MPKRRPSFRDDLDPSEAAREFGKVYQLVRRSLAVAQHLGSPLLGGRGLGVQLGAVASCGSPGSLGFGRLFGHAQLRDTFRLRID